MSFTSRPVPLRLLAIFSSVFAAGPHLVLQFQVATGDAYRAAVSARSAQGLGAASAGGRLLLAGHEFRVSTASVAGPLGGLTARHDAAWAAHLADAASGPSERGGRGGDGDGDDQEEAGPGTEASARRPGAARRPWKGADPAPGLAPGEFLLQMRPSFDGAEEAAVGRYLKAGGFVTEHTVTRALEEKLAGLLGGFARGVVMTTSGTSALYLALQALGVGPGDEVVVPDLTMVATANAAVALGAAVRFADVDPATLCLCPAAVERALTAHTKVVVFVHLNNRALPGLAEVLALCRARGVAVLEDAAQAVGARLRGRPLGTWADLGTFSFSSPKIVTTGQGGAVAVPDGPRAAELLARLRVLKDFGRAAGGGPGGAEAYAEQGLNFKFTDLQAALGLAQLAKLPGRVLRMRQLWERYTAGLAGVPDVTFLPPPPGPEGASSDPGWIPWFIDCFVGGTAEHGPPAATRAALTAWLKLHRVGVRNMYPSLVGEAAFAGHPDAQPRGGGDGDKGGAFPASRAAAEGGLFLPSSSAYDDGTVDLVCALIRLFFSGTTPLPSL